MALVTCPDCSREMSDAAPACPQCGRPKAPALREPVGKRSEAKDTLAGCIVQFMAIPVGGAFGALAWAACVFAGASPPECAAVAFSVGIVAFGLLLMLGRAKSTRWLCAACGSDLGHAGAVVCPGCKAPLRG